jgi:hypothetical protein
MLVRNFAGDTGDEALAGEFELSRHGSGWTRLAPRMRS